jgi:hypothetical protein
MKIKELRDALNRVDGDAELTLWFHERGERVELALTELAVTGMWQAPEKGRLTTAISDLPLYAELTFEMKSDEEED